MLSLNKYFENQKLTPVLSAEYFADIAIQHNFDYRLLAIACHVESHCGTRGRAVETNNMYNVGNTDAGDYKAVNCSYANLCLQNHEQGIEMFINLIKSCYFHENEEVKIETYIERDFRAVRCNIAGKRYMTDIRAVTKYTEKLKIIQIYD